VTHKIISLEKPMYYKKRISIQQTECHNLMSHCLIPILSQSRYKHLMHGSAYHMKPKCHAEEHLKAFTHAS